MASSSKNIQPIESQINLEDRKIAVDYEAIKASYFKLVGNNKEMLKAPLSTRKGIEEQIKRIIADPTEAEDLKVEKVDGKDILYLKKSKRSFIEVISVEEAFDVVLGIHVACKHGDVETTYEKLTATYSVPIFCVCWLVASCNVCNASAISEIYKPIKTELGVESFNNPSSRGIWRLNIIQDDSLGKNPRSSIYLLILKEDSTNFVVLRPLFESSEELALDLFKLFAEFGYPEKVFVPNNLNFYTQIFQIVHMIYPVEDVPVEESPNVEIFKKDRDEVLNEIRNWMAKMHDTYWEQCCHIVQYKLNTEEKVLTRLFSKEEYGIPFNLFFEYRFRTKMTLKDPPFYKNNAED